MEENLKEFALILKTEYSERFDAIRKKAMINSFYKYGPVRDNYGTYKCMDALGNLLKRVEKYKETGNTEFLADVANFAMIEFMNPSIEGAGYHPTGTDASDCSARLKAAGSRYLRLVGYSGHRASILSSGLEYRLAPACLTLWTAAGPRVVLTLFPGGGFERLC